MSTQALSRVRAIADTLYQDLYYTIGYSCTAGVGNGIGCARENERFDHGFGEGFCNNFPLGTVLNLMYPLLFRQIEESSQFRSYAHIITLGINLCFLGWHYYTGTEHPIQTMMPNVAIGLAMTNRTVTEKERTRQ
jgi:hypothetical protein